MRDKRLIFFGVKNKCEPRGRLLCSRQSRRENNSIPSMNGALRLCDSVGLTNLPCDKGINGGGGWEEMV
jgi:hypothetical protein